VARGALDATLQSAAERAVASGWARERDGDPGALRVLDAELAAIPDDHPLHAEATRLRIAARLRAGEPARAREAAQLSEANLGERPGARDLLLRAEAYAAAGEPAVALETIALLLSRLGREPGSHADTVRRAGQLVLAMPSQGELSRIRADLLARLGRS
jgi:hypothetical protein